MDSVKVSLSSTFISRAKCKWCCTPPTFYYFARNPTMWFDPRKITNKLEQVKKRVKNIGWITNPIIIDDPTYKVSNSSLSHHPNYKGYRPRLHRTRGSNAIIDSIEYLSCDCGKTYWAFSVFGSKKRPEITNRKARISLEVSLIK